MPSHLFWGSLGLEKGASMVNKRSKVSFSFTSYARSSMLIYSRCSNAQSKPPATCNDICASQSRQSTHAQAVLDIYFLQDNVITDNSNVGKERNVSSSHRGCCSARYGGSHAKQSLELTELFLRHGIGMLGSRVSTAFDLI